MAKPKPNEDDAPEVVEADAPEVVAEPRNLTREALALELGEEEARRRIP